MPPVICESNEETYMKRTLGFRSGISEMTIAL
jgi:hypothetical protein